MPNNNGVLQFTPGTLYKFFTSTVPTFLGTYTYENDGAVTPAISIDTVPNDVTVEGFEIVIPGFPRMPKRTAPTGRGFTSGSQKTSISSGSRRRFHQCQYWDVDFINHDSFRRGSLARKGEFFEMIQTLIHAYPRTENGIPFNQGEPAKDLQRYRLTFVYTDTYASLFA